MECLVKRQIKTTKSSVGDFFVNGKIFCNSIEDQDRGLTSDMPLAQIKKIKVYGETAIPTGRYQLVPYDSPKHGKCPLLVKVPGFDFTEIHSANNAQQLLGCTALGQYDKHTPDWISNSRFETERFYEVYFAAIDAGEEVWITYQ